MWLKISMLSTLSFCLMSRMRINLFLYMRKVKRCKPSSIVVKRKTKKALAKMFQCSEALVSGALKAAALPLELLQAYPSVVELGRPTIVKLHKQFNELNEAQREQLLAKCHQENGFVWQQSQAQGVARITKEVTETIESWIQDVLPPKRTETPKVEFIKGRASYARKGNNLVLNLKKIDDELMQDILDFVQRKLN